MSKQIFYVSRGKTLGPVSSLAELQRLAAVGIITPTTHVRVGANGAWMDASNINGLPDSASEARTRNDATTRDRYKNDSRGDGTLPLLDVDHHPLAVDVTDTEVRDFGNTQASGVGTQKDRQVLLALAGIKELRHLIERQDHRQPFRLLGARQSLQGSRLTEGHFVDETQTSTGDVIGAPGDLPLMDQMDQVLTDLLTADLLR